MTLLDFILKFVFAFLLVGAVMTLSGYSVLAERKFAAWIQGRVGPNRTSLPFIAAIPIIGPLLKSLGIWQPLADGAKFLLKEDPVPAHVNKPYFILAPALAFIPAMVTMVVVPFGQWWDSNGVAHPLALADLDLGILFIFAVSSLGVYGIFMAGWASNNKYAFLGGVRSSAQMISYELSMGLSILPVFIWANPAGSNGGLSLFEVVQAQEGLWLFMWQPISALVFLTALFAETNRLPFDMPESETELVGGFHTEYGSMKFAMFFLAEYAHMVVGSAVFVVLFLGGWNFLPGISQIWPSNWLGTVFSVAWFLAKVVFIILFFIWVRWTLPRFRYDQVMRIGWNILLPLAIGNLIFYIIAIGLWDLMAN